MKSAVELGFQFPEILLPNPTIDLQKWAVIACDQFTSQPAYWNQVENHVKDSPSTFHMILPEIYLGTDREDERITSTRNAMSEYLKNKIFNTIQGSVLVKRTASGKTRHGIMLALDLEAYDYNKGSTTLIRATEGTIIERLPPRIRIRSGAELELPHILVLIDDPKRTVIEPIVEKESALKRIYDLDLMLGGGHLSGFAIQDPTLLDQIVNSIGGLTSTEIFAQKYDVPTDTPILLFAMGDGNHSLATAKAIWNTLRTQVPANHPARFAMVEIENIHDPGLDFEPIHRILFGMKIGFKEFLADKFGSRLTIKPCQDQETLTAAVDGNPSGLHNIGMLTSDGIELISVAQPELNLPVGTLQVCLDEWLKQGGAQKIDYVHGKDVVFELGKIKGNAGFYLPGMRKSDLFKTVIKDGALPRKTFSMGEATDKRYYMECRKIV